MGGNRGRGRHKISRPLVVAWEPQSLIPKLMNLLQMLKPIVQVSLTFLAFAGIADAVTTCVPGRELTTIALFSLLALLAYIGKSHFMIGNEIRTHILKVFVCLKINSNGQSLGTG